MITLRYFILIFLSLSSTFLQAAEMPFVVEQFSVRNNSLECGFASTCKKIEFTAKKDLTISAITLNRLTAVF